MNKNDVHISKSLSWLLRHGAVKEGLNITSDGFVKVSHILKHRTLNNYALEDIQRVVENNDKKRFCLARNERGEYLIKASQGHSLECVTDLELEPILSSKTVRCVVHGTYLSNWRSIKSKGLSRMNRLHVHFAQGLPKEQGVISGLRTNAQVLIYIELDRALAAGLQFFRSQNGVILSPGNSEGIVPKEFFSKVVNIGTGELMPF